MPELPFTTPVTDTVPKVAGELAVGEDLDFQRRWWVFERLIWGVFVMVIVCDLLGLFGNGWLSKAVASVPDGSLRVEYEWVARASTPSTMTLHFGPGALRDGRVQVYVSDAIVQGLGAQRVAPQPASSIIGDEGIRYTFPVSASPAQVQIQLEPTAPGPHHFRVQIPGKPPIDAAVFVLP